MWQGKKASNPRPTVLETAALPAELVPYILLFSHIKAHHSGFDLERKKGCGSLSIDIDVNAIHPQHF